MIDGSGLRIVGASDLVADTHDVAHVCSSAFKNDLGLLRVAHCASLVDRLAGRGDRLATADALAGLGVERVLYRREWALGDLHDEAPSGTEVGGD